MDYSQFRRSDNFEDARQDPWTPLYELYRYAGMPRGIGDTTASIIEALKHPLTKQPEAITPYNIGRIIDYGPQPDSYPQGSLQEQLGANDVIKALRK